MELSVAMMISDVGEVVAGVSGSGAGGDGERDCDRGTLSNARQQSMQNLCCHTSRTTASTSSKQIGHSMSSMKTPVGLYFARHRGQGTI